MRKALPEHVALQVDGGIHEQTARPAAEAGANLLVTGSAVFGSEDPPGSYRRLVDAAWGGS
jgi:ribulose-phosphate 3-epimerase